jgi:hypothetical protein
MYGTFTRYVLVPVHTRYQVPVAQLASLNAPSIKLN